MWSIGHLQIDNQVLAAPLAGISDKAFRLIAKEMGAGAVYTEMISDKALVYRNQKTFELMDIQDEEGPIAVQIFGRDPEFLTPAARIMVERGAQWIDFNMGCPAPKVVKNGEGAALMKEPDVAYRAVEALVNAVDVPVTVKLRKGFDVSSVNVLSMAKTIQGLGVAAIAVHGRTRDQFYSGQADWQVIAEVVSRVDVPVIGNGDIWEPTDASRMLAETGCQAVMIGRGSFGNPWLIRQNLAVLAQEKPVFPTMEEKIAMALKHLRLAVHYKGERVGVREMRKQLSWYIKNGTGAARLRDEINQAEDEKTLIALLNAFLERQKG